MIHEMLYIEMVRMTGEYKPDKEGTYLIRYLFKNDVNQPRFISTQVEMTGASHKIISDYIVTHISKEPV